MTLAEKWERPPCAECGSTEHVVNFVVDMETMESRWLCWDHRHPIIQERMGPAEGTDEAESTRTSDPMDW